MDVNLLRRLRSEPHLNAAIEDWAGHELGALTAAAEVIAHQLRPVRTRAMLTESYRREAARTPAVRLAYAMVWLALGHGDTDGLTSRRRTRRATATAR